MSIFLSFGFAI